MSGVPYASGIGSIMYAMICTKLDVPYALSVSRSYQSDPRLAHWTAVKNILKYLKRTKDRLLVYVGDEELIVNGYTDASFITDINDYKSLSRCVYTLNGDAVVWKSFKQNIVSNSTTKAEYIATSETLKEAVWIKKFLEEVGVVPSAMNLMALCCDNSGAIAQAEEPRSHMKTRHIDHKYHIIRQYVEKGFVKVLKVHTGLNVSDPMTKALP
ncbi:secreted RxLR effector protein 161-like [Aegilops tauschii subsp. strangulata]|uniref:secreted RxLR effector protein 161-like n=1 Tax=Aegilops tauschii subsp. strangulata TaxID=200361 RepID=UPI003CC8B2AE